MATVAHLVVSSLKEGRVDGAERLHSLGGHPRGKSHRVLLRNAHIEASVGKALGEHVHARAAAHGGMDSHDALVRLCLRDQRLRKVGRVGFGFRGDLVLLARCWVKLHNPCTAPTNS